MVLLSYYAAQSAHTATDNLPTEGGKEGEKEEQNNRIESFLCRQYPGESSVCITPEQFEGSRLDSWELVMAMDKLDNERVLRFLLNPSIASLSNRDQSLDDP